VTKPGDESEIERLLARAREGLDRVRPDDLDREIAGGALVVDTRPVEQRDRDGELPSAIVVDRNVLEWRLDPTSPWRLPEAGVLARNGGRVVVVCNEGYSSSLAAATLRSMGVARATDLVGGYQGWLQLQHQLTARSRPSQ
jgi:rhodanese-related sulfurtransferase